ncbi:CDF family Co(II)/Ni(II) efflux transporter DmeF [Pseudomonas sp. NPDC089569]|uniref:CDF family Co(II)/Ni(II) efflux transporter DmeF n=1 Tax=Pseudomonas sp. NPDC089569 TaxID=3390722 RepID=UPI003D079301
MSSTNHVHDHVFLGSAHEENAKRTLWVVALTVVMMVGEIAAGYITGSMALLADGFHMATHAGALGIAAAAYGYAKRHATSKRYSFGTGKVGDLGGFASALILGIVALAIGVESVMRLLQPTQVEFQTATLIAIVGLIVNIVSALMLGHGHSHGHDHDHHGHDHAHHGHDNNLKSAYVHVLADALTSVLAIAALLAGRYLGWVWLDPVMGIVGAVVIARWSWSLIGTTSGVLLDQTDEHVAEEIRELVEKPGDATITDLHVWRIGPEAHAAIVSVLGKATANAESIRERLKPVHEVSHLTVEFRAA